MALYFATYFHLKNASCRKYLQSVMKSQSQADHKPLLDFIKLWESSEKTRLADIKPTTLQKFSGAACTFQVYLDETQRIEDSITTNPRRLQRLIEIKRLFSVPWLLAHESLFDKQDFMRQVVNYQQQ